MADKYLGESIKNLGFGLMRLPMLGEEIDIEQVKRMVDTFMSKGFTYFDTAYVYIGGKSEVALKEAVAVSYTHLDVYKRQGTPRRRRSPGRA